MIFRLQAPFPYFGGKSRIADVIWQRLGDVANYVEPFAGSLAVLLQREDGSVVDSSRVLPEPAPILRLEKRA